MNFFTLLNRPLRVFRAFSDFRVQSPGLGAWRPSRTTSVPGASGVSGVPFPGPARTLSTAALILCILAPATNAQTRKPPAKSTQARAKPAPYTGPSTQDGVFTDEQAKRGKDVYLNSCKSCHSPQSHTGATFNKFWRNHPLSDLYGFVSTKMPKNDPGSLAPEDAADVVAYLLKMNAMPVGPNELYPDADSLRQFRIETKRSRSTATGVSRSKP